MMFLLVCILSAFAVKPMLSLNAGGITNPTFGGVANTMMFDVPIDYTTATVNGQDHNVYLAIGTNSSAASTCSAANGVPSSPGPNWTYGKAKAAGPTMGVLHFIAYNFVPGTTYYWKAAVGSATAGWNVTCGTGASIGTQSLPAGLADLNLNWTKPSGTAPQSTYVLMDTDDCSATSNTHTGAKAYIVAIDAQTTGEIVWYLDIGAMTTETGTNKFTGWHYHAGAGTQNGHILGVVEHGYVYDWNFDGSTNYEINAADAISDPTVNHCNGTSGDEGPCVSHDAFQSSGGNTYVVTSYDNNLASTGTGWDGGAGVGCGAANSATFVEDGYSQWSSNSFVSDEVLVQDEAADYDPTAMTPPNDGVGSCTGGYWAAGGLYDSMIDYTHANAISVYRPSSTDWVNLSLLNWNQIIRFDGGSGALAWTLSGDGYAGVNALTLGISGPSGTASFGGQHGAHIDSGDNLVLFDNAGNRALKIALTGGNPGTRTTATINKSWIAADPVTPYTATLSCTTQGGAEMVGTSMLLDCNDQHTIEEYSDGAGDGVTGHAPELAITLTNGDGMTGGTVDICGDNAAGGADDFPNDASFIHGWYRAYPLANIGEY